MYWLNIHYCGKKKKKKVLEPNDLFTHCVNSDFFSQQLCLVPWKFRKHPCVSSASVSYLEAILCKHRGHAAFKAATANSLLQGRFNSKFHCHRIHCVIMKGSVSIDETEHINKKLAEVPADASLATIILMRVGEQCCYSPLKDSPQPHCIKDWNTTLNLCSWS